MSKAVDWRILCPGGMSLLNRSGRRRTNSLSMSLKFKCEHELVVGDLVGAKPTVHACMELGGCGRQSEID
jgi:hypothetical protein